MQLRTLKEYNHLKKVYFVKSKELNEIQYILDKYSETFEPKPETPEILELESELEDGEAIETIVEHVPNPSEDNL